MSLRWEVADFSHRLTITAAGTITSREFVDFSYRLYGQRTELFDYECVVDLSAYEGDLLHSDLEPLAQIYAGRSEGNASSCPAVFVTVDPFFHHWAAAMQIQFPGLIVRVAASREEAAALLDRLRTRSGDNC